MEHLKINNYRIDIEVKQAHPQFEGIKQPVKRFVTITFEIQDTGPINPHPTLLVEGNTMSLDFTPHI